MTATKAQSGDRRYRPQHTIIRHSTGFSCRLLLLTSSLISPKQHASRLSVRRKGNPKAANSTISVCSDSTLSLSIKTGETWSGIEGCQDIRRHGIAKCNATADSQVSLSCMLHAEGRAGVSWTMLKPSYCKEPRHDLNRSPCSAASLSCPMPKRCINIGCLQLTPVMRTQLVWCEDLKLVMQHKRLDSGGNQPGS